MKNPTKSLYIITKYTTNSFPFDRGKKERYREKFLFSGSGGT